MIFMEKLLRKIVNSKKSVRALRISSAVSSILIALSYFAVLYLAFVQNRLEALYVVCMTAIPFFIVSLFRRLFDAPRPYEIYDFYKEKPKEKKGRSFPSRHVFSGFIIASVAFVYSLPLSLLALALSVLLAVSRILLGIHFIRDCVCGALIGVIAAVIGITVFGLI